jgi:2-phospho-L-lactate/phosphoenolpyruvate guanylyltransferase
VRASLSPLYRGVVQETRWTAVVPVKEPKRAKSRLGPHLEAWRADLAAAFAADTLAALLSATRVHLVVVVGGQGLPGPLLDDARIRTLPDPGDLNTAVGDGIAWLRRHRPGTGVLVLAADLPAATGVEIDRLLAATSGGAQVLPDRERQGTTGLLLGPDDAIVPSFGARSLARHRSAGATVVNVAGVDGLRRDVDTAGQLAEAVELGVGRQTESLLRQMAYAHR